MVHNLKLILRTGLFNFFANMKEQLSISLAPVIAILSRYNFELKGYTPEELIGEFSQLYPLEWIRLAVIEALYQGRYKAVSVESILRLWLRRGHTTYHFTHEFERLICRNLSDRHGQPLINSVPEILPEARLIPEEAKSPQPTDNSRNLSVEQFPIQTSETAVPKESLSDLNHLFGQIFSLEVSNTVRPISEFTPRRDQSELYSKLKAVVQEN